MEFVGRKVKKQSLGFGVYSGTVNSYDPGGELFQIKYENGDSEELELSQLASILEEESAAGDELQDTTGPKQKKLRMSVIPWVPGNNSVAGTSSVDSKTLSVEELGDRSLNSADHGVDLNLNGGNNVNNGLDLNVPFNAAEQAELNTRARLKRGAVIDLNVYLSEDDDDESKLVGCNADIPKKKHCFDLNFGVDDEVKSLSADETPVKILDGSTETLGVSVAQSGQSGDSLGTMNRIDTSGVLDANCVNESGSSDVLMTDPTNACIKADTAVEENAGRKLKGNHRKRRKISDSATKTVLRRSARRGRAAISAQANAPGVDLDAVKDQSSSPEFCAVSEERDLAYEDRQILFPKPKLPPSSENLKLDDIPIFELFSVYSFLRSFSTSLFLSPFELDDFVDALRCKSPTLLFDYIHLSLLLTLRKHLELLSDESSESALICLRSLNWNFLDLVTWPIYMVEYFLTHRSFQSPAFDLCRLKLFQSDYYKQPASVKIEMLRCLCDDVNEGETIRSELNRRTMASDMSTEFDRRMMFETSRKGKAVMDVSGTSCLTSEVVDETADWNSDECCLCKMDGSLICCDGCPAAFHSRCVGVASSLLPEGEWYCPECTIDKDKPWIKVGKSIRGAELLGIDPYGRLYYNSCGYLLVSDSDDMESPLRYYHVNDFTAVLEAIKSSHRFYNTLFTAIMKFWNVSSKVESEMGSQTVTVAINCVRKGRMLAAPLIKSFQDDAPDEGEPEEKSMISSSSGNVGCNVSEPVTVDNSMKVGNPIVSSEGSTEISQAITGGPNLKNTRSSKRSSISSDIKISEKPVYDGNCPLSSTNLEVEHEKDQFAHYGAEPSMLRVKQGTSYVNFYSFARTASSAAEALLRKSSDKVSVDSKISVEEMISAQLKVLSSIPTEFCWSNIRNLDADAMKEKCGWCISCKVSEDGGDCLFIVKDTSSVLQSFTSELLGIHPEKNWESHLIDVMCHILCIEDRLHGLLLGPWLNPHYSKIWRTAVCKASDVASLKHFLVMLESNLHIRAFSAEWHRQVDSATTVGSASHIVINSHRSSSKHGITRKRSRCPDSESNPSTAASGLGLLWWRGGRISRELFKWKVLTSSLASKAARQAGSKKIPGIIYSDSSDFAKRSKCAAWRASVDASSSVDQLALQVRELDANIKWETIENTQFLSKMDKEFRKTFRSFKKVIIRRKLSEGTVGKYLLDFGKRRFIPDIVVKHGSLLEEPSSIRKKYWLEESYVPLHLFKAFEEKRIARKISKACSTKLQESGRVFKKFSKKTVFAYLFSKAERSEYYQCRHCKKDVLIREAVSCQYCEGNFHKRHVRKSAGLMTSKCTYACHKCEGLNNLKIDNKNRNPKLQKDKMSSKVKRSMHSKTSTLSVKDKQSKHSESSKKNVVIPLRRSMRKVKVVSRQNEDRGGLKKGKQTTSKKKNLKRKRLKKQKKPKQGAWKKKRTLMYYPYWLNGLRLSRKPSDEKVMKFGSERLLLASEQLNTTLDKPKCSLCCETEYTSALNYIGCEMCEDWYHGDAFGLVDEKIGYLIGFRCHKCRGKAPPVCLNADATRVAEGQFDGSNSSGLGCNEGISNNPAIINEHAGTCPDFSPTLVCDAEHEHIPISLEQREEPVPDREEKNVAPPGMSIGLIEDNSWDNVSLETCEAHSVKVTTVPEMESQLVKSNVDMPGKQLASSSCHVKNDLEEETDVLGSAGESK